MRIIGGELKGRRFSPPGDLQARPTTDMAKESLFNILNNTIDFEAVSVLDLFAGTGSISLEFASRGCTNITAIEKNSTNHNFIRQVTRQLGVENAINLIKGDAFKFMERTGAKWDIIFADPPYDLPQLQDIPDSVFNHSLLAPDGILVVEHPRTVTFATHPRFTEHRNYGHVNFTFFK